MPVKVILLLLFVVIKGYSQEVALLDRSFKNPITYTDSVTARMVEKGAFPMYVEDAQELIRVIDWFLKNMNSEHPQQLSTREVRWGNTQLFTYTKFQGRSSRCQLVVKTIIQAVSTSLVLVDESDPIPSALKKLNQIRDYIQNNLALLKEDKLISYNVIKLGEP